MTTTNESLNPTVTIRVSSEQIANELRNNLHSDSLLGQAKPQIVVDKRPKGYDISVETKRFNLVNIGRDATLSIRVRHMHGLMWRAVDCLSEELLTQSTDIFDTQTGDKEVYVNWADTSAEYFGATDYYDADEGLLFRDGSDDDIETSLSMKFCLDRALPSKRRSRTPPGDVQERTQEHEIDEEYEKLEDQLRSLITEYILRTHSDPTEKLRKALTGKIVISPTMESPIVVNNDFKIILPDYDEVELKMSCIQKMLYMFFMRHPDGVRLKDLVDHASELAAIYSCLKDCPRAEAMQKVEQYMCSSELRNQALSKINRIVTRTVKWPEANGENPYVIAGKRGDIYRLAIGHDKIRFNPQPEQWIDENMA